MSPDFKDRNTMSRFNELYQHFEAHVAPVVKALPNDKRRLAFAYRDGAYSVYENSPSNLAGMFVEVNPAKALTQEHTVWFFYGAGDKLEAYVEYQPDYRDTIYVENTELPLLVMRPKKKPLIPGFTH